MKKTIGAAAFLALASVAPASAQDGGLLGGLLGAGAGAAIGGAVGGSAGAAIAGGIIGGATGAIIGQQAERRGRYYYYDSGCYVRVARGRYRMVSARYCY
ncbi:MAG: hypothetical protein KDJ20_01505 [Hyphomicrobiales bacterium]|nr:hypothetical protein [Hyphomicrobiales bacterium]MCC2106656.1 hypothetical protein [Hyphomicrobiales bacterium]